MISPEKFTGRKTIVCGRCSSEFECNAGEIYSCQCSTVPVKNATLEFLKKTSWDCLCLNCLHHFDSIVSSLVDAPFPKPTELKKNIHYYMENEFCVFTEQYHILRGTCCRSGCRHCPYGFKKQQ